MTRRLSPFLVAAVLVAGSAVPSRAQTGSAPRSALDPQAEITGVFAFVGTRYDDANQPVLDVIAQVRPGAGPSGGAQPRFSDDVLYSLHVTHPATGEPVVRYDFRFSSADSASSHADADGILAYGAGTEVGSILSVGDARQNYVQTYSVRRVLGGSTGGEVLAKGLSVPPPNVGPRVTPLYNDATGSAVSGATTFGELDPYTAATIHELPDGEAVFAGTRDDAFYGDMAAIHDLLHPRMHAGDGLNGGGPDSYDGVTVLAFAVQVPLRMLPRHAYTDALGNASSGVGVFASASRRARTRTAMLTGPPPWEQVSRMGNPLFGSLVLSLRHRDAYRLGGPQDDAAFATSVAEPRLAALFNQLVLTSFVESNRTDLVALYLPDVLRVDTTTGPVPLPGVSGFRRLSVFEGDTTAGHPSGWPNGRRPGDDVVDILFTFLASGPAFSPTVLRGDNVNANDQIYNRVFPYLATPHSGTNP